MVSIRCTPRPEVSDCLVDRLGLPEACQVDWRVALARGPKSPARPAGTPGVGSGFGVRSGPAACARPSAWRPATDRRLERRPHSPGRILGLDRNRVPGRTRRTTMPARHRVGAVDVQASRIRPGAPAIACAIEARACDGRPLTASRAAQPAGRAVSAARRRRRSRRPPARRHRGSSWQASTPVQRRQPRRAG